MKRILLWLTVVAVVAIGILIYQSRSRNRYNVTPDAERAIEKAMHR